MGFSIGFGVGPLRYSKRLGGRRRRSSSGEGVKMIGAVIGAVIVLGVALVGLAAFVVSIAIAPVAGALAGAFSKTSTAGDTASRYVKTTVAWYAKKINYKKKEA